jgi:hypothetical protein
MYSNPAWFLEQWIAEMFKQREEAKAARKARREERLKKKVFQIANCVVGG